MAMNRANPNAPQPLAAPGLLNPAINRGAPLPRDQMPALYPQNASPALDPWNRLTQMMAQGQAPGMQNYYRPSAFRTPGGGFGNMAQYMPPHLRNQIGQQQNFPHDWYGQAGQQLHQAFPGGGTGLPPAGGAPPAGTPPTGAPAQPNAAQAWHGSLSPEQQAMLGGANGNRDLRASLSPEQLQLRQAAITARQNPQSGPPAQPAGMPQKPAFVPDPRLVNAGMQQMPQGSMWNPATQPQGQRDMELAAQQAAMAQQTQGAPVAGAPGSVMAQPNQAMPMPGQGPMPAQQTARAAFLQSLDPNQRDAQQIKGALSATMLSPEQRRLRQAAQAQHQKYLARNLGMGG